MATSKPQDTMGIKMHKRIAMGEKLDGTAMQPKGGNKTPGKPTGGLNHLAKKK